MICHCPFTQLMCRMSSCLNIVDLEALIRSLSRCLCVHLSTYVQSIDWLMFYHCGSLSVTIISFLYSNFHRSIRLYVTTVWISLNHPHKGMRQQKTPMCPRENRNSMFESNFLSEIICLWSKLTSLIDSHIELIWSRIIWNLN